MQGVYVRARRVATKKALKEAVAENSHVVALEATSLFGNEYDGFLFQAPNGVYNVVGPCPHTNRKWYATITVKDGDVKVK